MNSLPTSIMQELHKLASDAPIIYLLEITGSDGVNIAYLARNVEDVIWNGHTWTKFWFELDTITEQSSGQNELYIYTDNIAGWMEELLLANNNLEECSITIYFVNTNCLAETEPIYSVTYYTQKPVVDILQVGIKLGVDNPYLQNCPAWLLHGSYCKYPVFKTDPRCAYAGSETECDRSLERCIELGNQLRFGGALGLFRETQDL